MLIIDFLVFFAYTHRMASRRFAATICLNNGTPMEDVSKLPGHSGLKTTAIYGRITQEMLQKSIDIGIGCNKSIFSKKRK